VTASDTFFPFSCTQGAEHVRSKDKADDEMEDEDDEEDEGVGIVELHDDALTGEAIWQFEDRSIGTEEDAVKGFILETLRQVCADFLVRREYKGMAYFLHPEGETQRAVSSVDVARGFRRKGVHQQCVEYLKAYAVEKQVCVLGCVCECLVGPVDSVRQRESLAVRNMLWSACCFPRPNSA
jgi:hypothetical protein